MNKSLLITVLLLTGCGLNNNSPSPTAIPDTKASGIIGGYEETSEKILNFVYRLRLVSGNCTSVQMQDGLILTANHCLRFGGAVREVGLFARNDVDSFVGSGALFSFKNQSDIDAADAIIADDMAAAVIPVASKRSTGGFLYPDSADLPEELFIAGYGNDRFGGFSNGASSIPLRGLAISKSKQLLKNLSPEEMGFRVDPTAEKVLTTFKKIEEFILAKKLFCIKPRSQESDSANHGDSGGPLYSLNKNGEPVLRGIFSTIIGLSDQTFFFCYTSVIPYIEWAHGITKNWENLLNNKLTFKTSTQSLTLDSQILGGISLKSRSQSGFLVDASLGRQDDLKGLNLSGKIALIQRGEIPFINKIMNAKRAGALAIIFYNNDPASDKAPFTFDNPSEKEQAIANPLDARMISTSDGQTLVELLKAGTQVEATLTIP